MLATQPTAASSAMTSAPLGEGVGADVATVVLGSDDDVDMDVEDPTPAAEDSDTAVDEPSLPVPDSDTGRAPYGDDEDDDPGDEES